MRPRRGVQGLTIEAWSAHPLEDRPLGRGLTDTSGSYQFELDEEGLKREPRVYLTARDRYGKLIHSASDRPRRVRIRRSNTAHVRIEPDVLDEHLREPLGLDEGKPIIPPGARSDVLAAIEQLVSRDEPDFLRFRNAAMCPWPPFELFDEFHADAIRVLNGDFDAAVRFLDTIATLQEGLPPGGPGQLVMRLLGGRPDSPDPASAAVDATAGGMLREDCGCGAAEAVAPEAFDFEQVTGRPSIVRLEAAAAMFHAAARLGAGDRQLMAELVGTVLIAICGMETFGALHRSAIDVLANKAGAAERFRGIVGLWGADCGPDDGPALPFPKKPRRCIPIDIFKRQCLVEAFAQWSGQRRGYTITGISPTRACAGQQITVTGTGFGSTPGLVRFKAHTVGLPIDVVADSWTDTTIVVTVPQGAGCGLSLIISVGTIVVCNRFVDLKALGFHQVEFGGTSPEIQSFYVTRPGAEICLRPGEVATLRWQTCAADAIRVELVRPNGDVLVEADPAPASGSLTYTVPTTGTTERWEARITATGTCAPAAQRTVVVWPQNPVDLRVDGLEVTQAIQFYRAAQHLTDANDRGPDNSVQLIAGKTAWVRVYVRSGQVPTWDGGRLTGVTGTLRVERIVGGVAQLVTVLNPQAPGSVTAEAAPGYDQERRNILATLNFVIPANAMTGRLRLTAAVQSADAHCGDGQDSGQATVDVDLAQTANFAGIMVGYNGPNAAGTANIVLNAPNLAALQTTAPLTIAMFPLADAATFRNAGTFTQTVPLTDALGANGSGCTPNWDAFMAAVRGVMVADGNQVRVIYYGLMVNGIPMGPVGGCGGGGLGTGPVGAQGTMAHEVGHALGLQHAPCGNPPRPDLNYPVYEPYDPPNGPAGARIGEYGLDTRNGTVFRPPTTDNMSYCGGWISLYHYNLTLNVQRLTPTAVPAGVIDTGAITQIDEPSPLIDVVVTLDVDGSVSAAWVRRVRTRPESAGQRTDLMAELLDEQGDVLAAAPVVALDVTPMGCGCGGDSPEDQPRRLQASIPDVARGAALRLRRGGDELWRREAPARAPEVGVTRARLRKDGRLDLAWTVERAPEADPEIWVRWSSDRGRSWRAVAVGLTGQSALLDISHVPGGTTRFQVMVHDGFSTATAETEDFDLPDRPPSVAILAPGPDETLQSGQSIRLWGAVNTVEGEPVEDEEARWTIDDEVVGEGLDVWIPPLSAGTHQVALLSHGVRVEHKVRVLAG